MPLSLPRRVVNQLQRGAVPFFLFICIARGAFLFTSIELGDSWMDGVVLGFGLAAALVVLARRLPIQNAITISVLIGIISGVFELVLADGDFILPPWALPVVWVIALINARGVGQWILQPWRETWGYGFWLIGLTSLLTASCVTGVSLVTGQAEADDSIWGSLGLRFVVSCVILVANTTWFIRKNPAPRPFEKAHSWLWIGFSFLIVLAAGLQGLWEICGAGIGVNLVLLVVMWKR